MASSSSSSLLPSSSSLAKVKIAGLWTGTIDVNIQDWTLSMLRLEIARFSDSNPDSINLISSGRLLKPSRDDHDPKLSELGLRHNSKVMATKVSIDQGLSLQQQALAEEQRSSKLARLKAAVFALSKRHADGSVPIEDYNIQLEDQSGQKINMGSETDQRAIMMGLMLHSKGKELISTQQFKDAREVLGMGEEAFSLCDPTLLERVDNVPILQIDMVWCYFMLRDINLLSVAGERLEKAKKGIERSHGKDGSRVRQLQSSRCPELALYLRLELLEGVAAFHCGKLEKSRQSLTSAKAKYSKLQVSDEDLSLLMSMGYKQHSAIRALKLNEQHVESAVNFLEEEKEKQAKKRADDLKRQAEIMEQKKFGKTPLGKAVDLEKLGALVSISFEKELAAEALRRNENDALKALDDLTNLDTKTMIQIDLESKKRKRQQRDVDASISHLLSMGFDRSRVTEALNTQGSTSKALDELLRQDPTALNTQGSTSEALDEVLRGEDPTAAALSERMRAAATAVGSSSGVYNRERLSDNEGENHSTSSSRDGSPSSSHGVEERDVEIEDELTHALDSKDAYSDYDIDISKEAEALHEYLAMLDSAVDAANPSFH